MRLNYSMSLVHKIPPLVSALAFGYGVGMTAPDSTITPLKDAVHVQKPIDGQPLLSSKKSVLLPNVGRTPPNAMTGEESRELSKLRDAQMRDEKKGASCDLEQPTYSHYPPNQSLRDRLPDDVDDLDAAGTEALSRLQLPDIRISITRRTLKYVKYFTRTERGRALFETWLKRSGRYQETIQQELRERRLPDDLIWLAMIESGFDPRAKSPAGAVGLWQFMPATGSVYGLLQNRFLDQRKNPRLASQAAAHHLRDLYMRFGNWDLAMAAYNMGYEQLLDAIDKYGTADFNELARQEAIPQETAAYVPKIAAAAIVANNLEHFGFDRVEVSRPVDSAELPMPPGTPMRILAKACGVSAAQLRALNPDILTDRVPPGHGDYLVYVPSDTLARARAALPAMLENEPIVTDDAQALSEVDGLGGRELMKRQRREDESLLTLLPEPKHHRSLREPAMDAIVDDVDDHASSDDDGDDTLGKVTPRAKRRHKETVVYKVGQGDSVIGIARQFGVDIDDLAQMNHLDVDDKLKAGTLIKLRVRKDFVDGVPRDEKLDRDLLKRSDDAPKAAPVHEHRDDSAHHHRNRG